MYNAPRINILFGFNKDDYGDFDQEAVTKALEIQPDISHGSTILPNGTIKPAGWGIELALISCWTIQEALDELEKRLLGKTKAVHEICKQLDLRSTLGIYVHCPGGELPALVIAPKSLLFWGNMGTAIGKDLYIDEA